MNRPTQFARGSLPAAAKAARPHPSLCSGRAATFNHSQHQRLTRTERGKLVGMCASTLGVAKTGRRFAGLGCLLPYLAGRFGARSFSQALSQIDGIGRRANAILAAVIQNGRQGTFQRLAKGPHSHSSVPFRKSGSDEDNRRAEDTGRRPDRLQRLGGPTRRPTDTPHKGD